MYLFVAAINGLRHRMPRELFAGATQYERYVADNLYVFMRGDVVAAITNSGEGGATIRQTVKMLPWTKGTTVCNVFYPAADCLTVTTDYELDIVLTGGEPKLFAPAKFMPKAQYLRQ